MKGSRSAPIGTAAFKRQRTFNSFAKIYLSPASGVDTAPSRWTYRGWPKRSCASPIFCPRYPWLEAAPQPLVVPPAD